MYQLMIVDDETSVVDSLALTIPWERCGIGKVYRAYSGQEALQIAAKQSIDIMITDIQMPEMDGFELIEQVRRFSPKIRNIILSGHDDFKYAQKAITHQTIEYLLKPVNFKMLVKIVEKAIRNLESELLESISYQHMKQTVEVNMPLLKSQLLNDLLKNKEIELHHLQKRLSVINTTFQSDDLFKMLVIRIEEDFSGYDLKSISLLEFAVNNIAEDVFQDRYKLWSCITDQGYLVYVIKSKNRDDLNIVDSYAVKLQNYVQKFLKGSLTICLSNLGIFPNDLYTIYRKAVKTILQNVRTNKSNFITISNGEVDLKWEDTVNFHESPTILSLLESNDWEGALSRISHILSINDKQFEPSQDHLYRAFLYLASSFSSIFKGEDKTVEEQLGDDFYLLLHKKSLITKQRVFDWAEKNIHRLMEQTSHQLEDSQQRIVAQVRSYIHENLASDISLQALAEKVNLHPVYLSKLYKNITNETISDYILQLRMDRADYLLRNSRLRITEVSNELGFFSQSHFIKVFKKQFGCTPQQHRHKDQAPSFTTRRL